MSTMVRPAGVEVMEQGHDLDPGRAVEVAGRLVGEDHGGSVTMARAMATRCCWPPDSSLGIVVQAFAEAEALERRRWLGHRSRRPTPWYSRGVATFSRADVRDSRL